MLTAGKSSQIEDYCSYNGSVERNGFANKQTGQFQHVFSALSSHQWNDIKQG